MNLSKDSQIHPTKWDNLSSVPLDNGPSQQLSLTTKATFTWLEQLATLKYLSRAANSLHRQRADFITEGRPIPLLQRPVTNSKSAKGQNGLNN